MPDIIKELNLNKHPKNCKNLSLVYAKNVRVSNDLSCLQNEESIYKHTDLIEQLEHKIIVGYIPCNKEIIFITTDSVPSNLGDEVNAYIERYNELENTCRCVYENYKYYGGEIKGTFTYNINSELILAITEFDYNNNLFIPLHTINLGKWDGDVVDEDLDYDTLATNPSIKIPAISNFNYISGTAYKGWYNFFIRFKLNNRDYTKWYHIGFPILLDEIFNSTIFKYYQPDELVSGKEYPGTVYGGDAYAKTSNILDICSKTIKLYLDFDESVQNKTYQIGFICSTKTYSKAFKTSDIISSSYNTFTVDFNILDEYSIEDLVLPNYNYYNVKNIVNYKNKLYISNYKDSLFDYIQLQDFVKSKCNITIMNDEVIRPRFINNVEEEEEEEEPIEEPEQEPYYKSVNISLRVKNTDGGIFGVYSGDILNNTDLITTSGSGVIASGGIGPDSVAFSAIEVLECTVYDKDDNIIPSTIFAHIYRSRPNIIFRVDIYKGANLTTGNQDDLIIGGYIKSSYSNGVLVGAIFNEEYRAPRPEHLTPGYDPSSSSITFNSTYEYNYNLLKETTLLPGEEYNFYIHFVNKYGEYSDGIRLTEEPITIPKNYGTKEEMIKYYPRFTITDDIPNNFGYFLSYERLQKIKTYSGVVYKENNNGDIIYKFYSGEIDLLDKINLQGTDLEILDRIYTGNPRNPRDYISQVGSKLLGTNTEKLDEKLLDNKYYFWNKDSYSYSSHINKKIKSIELVAAEDYTKSNNGRGTYLKIILENNDDEDILDDVYYLANINNYNSGQYKNEIKTLIKFTNIIYTSGTQSFKYGLNGRVTQNNTLIYNKDGVVLDTSINALFTNNFIPYYKSDVLYNYGNKKFATNKQSGPTRDVENENISAPIVIFSFYEYSDILLEGKRINNKPQFYPLNATLPDTKNFKKDSDYVYVTPMLLMNIITEPKNSIDLFKEVNGSQDFINPLTYVNYDENVEYQNVFDKRIQRSNVIQDESIVNSWRFFPVEGYKDITENKGKITNLIAIGTTLLAHTEHSLFMFDRDNTLQTYGKDVQLSMPDIFDVDYREVFTSELGTAGLQDPKAFVVDTFGYIFYDNDSYTLYRFGEKQLKLLDFNVVQFFFKYRPYQIRFANDKSNNRILLDIKYVDLNNDKEIVLSYNINLEKFISFHTYNFEESTNTKNNIYLFKKLKQANTDIFHILGDWKNGNRNTDITNEEYLQNGYYNYFENTFNNFNKAQTSQIDIIVNDSYEAIKYLEFIVYKLYEIENGTELNNNLNFPVEEMRTPSAGLKIRVYNGNNTADRIDTGLIDVSQAKWNNLLNSQNPMAYKLPYWHNGNWNFNYLRDKLNQKDSRIWGNYFIISFEFAENDNRSEFETLGYSITKSENI